MEQRIFAVHDFIVGEGKNEIFAESINEREGDFVVFVFAVDGVGRKIFQGVVHPSHVPFKVEAQAAEIGGAGNAGPGGGFFGDGEDSGEAFVRDGVERFEKLDGIEIFAAAEAIGNPFAGFAGVIEIQHGGD